jgi:diguanylate cyclase (GGDEF)-like protein
MHDGGAKRGYAETGLLDRAGLERTLDAELSRAARHQLPLSLVMLEVSTARSRPSDEEVSRLARDVAAAVEHRIRHEDHVARLGQLRFAVLAVETGESESIADDLASHVRQALARSQRNGSAYTVSVGEINCQYDELSAKELLRETERSLAAAILAGTAAGLPTAQKPPSPLPRSGQQRA